MQHNKSEKRSGIIFLITVMINVIECKYYSPQNFRIPLQVHSFIVDQRSSRKMYILMKKILSQNICRAARHRR